MKTHNPLTGCRHDCPYCYARDIAEKMTGIAPRRSVRSSGVVEAPALSARAKPVMTLEHHPSLESCRIVAETGRCVSATCKQKR